MRSIKQLVGAVRVKRYRQKESVRKFLNSVPSFLP